MQKGRAAMFGAKDYKYFLTYSGVRLPLNLVRPLEPDELEKIATLISA